jgi:DMSO/TMAO reductase YedYZ molybdopterin-dependent catalytic subunit
MWPTFIGGAKIRLRVEIQLGFKMVKWICAIEVVEDYSHIGEGQGGWHEDNQYYGTGAGIQSAVESLHTLGQLYRTLTEKPRDTYQSRQKL